MCILRFRAASLVYVLSWLEAPHTHAHANTRTHTHAQASTSYGDHTIDICKLLAIAIVAWASLPASSHLCSMCVMTSNQTMRVVWIAWITILIYVHQSVIISAIALFRIVNISAALCAFINFVVIHHMFVTPGLWFAVSATPRPWFRVSVSSRFSVSLAPASNFCRPGSVFL